MLDWLERLETGISLKQIQQETQLQKAAEPNQIQLEEEHRKQLQMFFALPDDTLHSLFTQITQIAQAFSQEHPNGAIPGPVAWRYNALREVIEQREATKKLLSRRLQGLPKK